MGVLGDSLCFCKGVGKSERTKATIFSAKGPAMARISANGPSGTAFLIHRSLLLTTHVNLPSVSAAEGCEIRLQNGVAATLVPHRWFLLPFSLLGNVGNVEVMLKIRIRKSCCLMFGIVFAFLLVWWKLLGWGNSWLKWLCATSTVGVFGLLPIHF